MKYDFETIVKRNNIGSLKNALADPRILGSGFESFSSGEADFKTAPSVCEAIKKMADNGLFGFTLPDDYYLDHIVYWMKTVRRFDIQKDWIVPALGTIMSLTTCIKAFTKEGENIIVAAPYYSRYKQAADRLKRGTVVSRMKYENGEYILDLDDIEKQFQVKENKIFVLCNPVNPSGSVFSENQLKGLAALSEKYGVYVFSDEIFADICLDIDFVRSYVSIPEAQKYGITCTSLGKSFSLTGMNHANVIIPDDDLRERFQTRRTNDHFGSIDPCAYAATIGGYSPEGLDWLLAACDLYKENLSIVKSVFDNSDKLSMANCHAGFVCFLNFSGMGFEDDELKDYLIDNALLDLDPGYDYGPCFGTWARMSLASTKEQTMLAMERLKKIL